MKPTSISDYPKSNLSTPITGGQRHFKKRTSTSKNSKCIEQNVSSSETQSISTYTTLCGISDRMPYNSADRNHAYLQTSNCQTKEILKVNPTQQHVSKHFTQINLKHLNLSIASTASWGRILAFKRDAADENFHRQNSIALSNTFHVSSKLTATKCLKRSFHGDAD